MVKIVTAVVTMALLLELAAGCSNLLVPGGSSNDGSTIISYSADSTSLFGAAQVWPAANHKPGACQEVISAETNKPMAKILLPPETYNVVGMTNEHQVSVTETTFGGLEILSGEDGRAVCKQATDTDPTWGCLDYANLMPLVLQRSKTAQEAIKVLDQLIQTYGWASSGESFSIADQHEVWLMEVIGKGNFSRGAVWVATRIPDGHLSAHANQARTLTIKMDDPDMQYAPDVISFAENIGAYDRKKPFSFSDVYDPVTWQSARFCDARVWNFFRKVAAPEEKIESYLDYVRGENLLKRLPVYVKAARKISVNETLWHMRDHYEGSWFDPRHDVGGQQFASPYRLGEGLAWEYENKTYVNERFIGTPQAGWNLVANQRPKERFGVMWFGVDDSTFSLHAPIYGVTSRLPKSWSAATCGPVSPECRERHGLPGTRQKFSMDAMYWVTNLVANYAYSRYDVISPDVFTKLAEIEARSMRSVLALDEQLRRAGPEAVAMASNFSESTADALHQEWRAFFGELFVKFVDGYVIAGGNPMVPGFRESWKQRIVADTGEHYRAPRSDTGVPFASIPKLSLRALAGIDTCDKDAKSCAQSRARKGLVV